MKSYLADHYNISRLRSKDVSKADTTYLKKGPGGETEKEFRLWTVQMASICGLETQLQIWVAWS